MAWGLGWTCRQIGLWGLLYNHKYSKNSFSKMNTYIHTHTHIKCSFLGPPGPPTPALLDSGTLKLETSLGKTSRCILESKG